MDHEKTIKNGGLWHLSGGTELYNRFLDRANTLNDIMHGVSDGSVR